MVVATSTTAGLRFAAFAFGRAAFTGANVVFTAVGGSIGPFRYVVVYDLTSATNPLVAWYDYGSAVTLLSGQDFEVDFTTNVNILTIT